MQVPSPNAWITACLQTEFIEVAINGDSKMTDQTHITPVTVSLWNLTSTFANQIASIRKLAEYPAQLPVSKRSRQDIGLDLEFTCDDARNQVVDIASRNGIPL